MFHRKEKKLLYKLFNTQVFISVIGLILIVMIGLPISRNINKKRKIDDEIKSLENKIATIEKKNLEVEELINYFNSEEFLEEKARLSLGLKKEGEEAVLIKGLGDAEILNAQEDKELKDNNNFWKNPDRWINYFFN